MLSNASLGDGFMQTNKAVFLPFSCGYSQVFCSIVLSGLQSSPELCLFIDSCLIADLCRGMEAESPTPSW